MKTALLAALLLAVTPALAYPQANKTPAANPNYGKADDYGSDRFAMLNQCMIGATHNKTPDSDPLETCMSANGYHFLPDAHVFGNRGPKCKSDEEGEFHSWCWGHL
jgi:hypothetical protein